MALANDHRTDDALLSAAARDPAAFGAFHARHEVAVLAFFRRRAGSPELAADLTAETSAAALQGARRAAADCDGGGPAMTVLPQVQDELARAARRRARRRGPGRVARGGPAAVLVGGTLTAGATATGLIELDRGAGAGGPDSIVAAAAERDGSVATTFLGGGEDEVCLEVRRAGRRTTYGCGPAPTEAVRRGLACTEDGTPVVRCEDR
jgi:hypothetical protein